MRVSDLESVRESSKHVSCEGHPDRSNGTRQLKVIENRKCERLQSLEE